jgi:acyl-coenzyme A thioesterase PaaI-like protein
MALADSLGAACAYLNLPDGAVTSTIESKTNFFRGGARATLSPVDASSVTARRRRHAGASSIGWLQ